MICFRSRVTMIAKVIYPINKYENTCSFHRACSCWGKESHSCNVWCKSADSFMSRHISKYLEKWIILIPNAIGDRRNGALKASFLNEDSL